MRASAHVGSLGGMRIFIIDEHEVYRAACAALLRTQGLEVTDVAPGRDVVGLARSLQPEAVLLDAAPPAEQLLQTARQLRSLPCCPTVVLASSAARDRIDPRLAELRFVAKADVCRDAIARAIADRTDELPERRESE
jgi:DNA-binding NarL/FixJ family response regulator